MEGGSEDFSSVGGDRRSVGTPVARPL